MENYYEILHVANFAEIEIVKAAYKAITKLYHPDVNHQVDSSVMVMINLAYETIGDPEKKARYDETLRSYLKIKQNADESKGSRCDQSDNTATDNYSTPESDEMRKTPKSTSKAGKVLRTVGKAAWEFVDAFLEGARELQRESENAYYKGIEYDDWELIRMYLKSTGPKRHGYMKVLKERGLLYEENGEFVPSYEFKRISRYL